MDGCHVYRCAHQASQCCITAVYGDDEERAKALAQQWNIPYGFTIYDNMIPSWLIDAVMISTVNKTHFAMAMKGLETGLYVLCERPLAMNIP